MFIQIVERLVFSLPPASSLRFAGSYAVGPGALAYGVSVCSLGKHS